MQIAIVPILPGGQDAPAFNELLRLSSSALEFALPENIDHTGKADRDRAPAEKSNEFISHALTSDPEQADLIVFTDLDPRGHYETLRRHPWVRRYFEKCAVVYHWHEPYGFLPGIYTEVPQGKARWPDTLYRSGLYWPAHHTNAAVREQGAVFARKRLARAAGSFPFLFSFMGRNSHSVRGEIMQLPREFIAGDGVARHAHLELTDNYDHWHQEHDLAGTAALQKRYMEIALESAFVLCPRGLRRPSIRLFEMMQLGVCPVVLSDGYKFPDGPDWESFCIVVPEGDAGRLWEILSARENEAAERGRLARLAWDTWFTPERQFGYMVDVLEDIQSLRHPRRERKSLWWRWPLRIAWAEYEQRWRWLHEKMRQKKMLHAAK